MRRPRLKAAFAALALLFFGTAARADDFHVDAESTLQAYEIRSPGTAAFLTRRRFVQTLGLTYVKHLEPRRDGPRILAEVDLRLDQEYGETCLVARDFCFRGTDSTDPGTYQPLVETTRLDARSAFIEVDGLPFQGRARAGRHLVYSTIGFLRLDGASARATPTEYLAIEAYGGAMVRRTSFLGSSAFEAQGVLRLDLPDVDPSRVPFVAPPATTYAYGAALEVGLSRIVRGRAEFRELRDTDGLVASRLGLGLSSAPLAFVRAQADTVLDTSDGTLVTAHGGLALQLTDDITTRFELERHVPRFDQGTIWAYFDVVPVTEARVVSSFTLSSSLTLGAGLHGRVASFEDGDERDAGVEASVDARVWRTRVSLHGYGWRGSLGPVAAGILSLERPLFDWLALEGRTSIWYVDDPLRDQIYGVSFVEAIAARAKLTEQTSLRFDLEHAHSRIVGSRLRALVSLNIEVWR